MRTPSRFMFATTKPTLLMRAFGWAVCLLVYGTVLALTVALLTLVYRWWPPASLMLATALAFAIHDTRRQMRHQRDHLAQLIQSRQGESICQFARSFDTHQVDTWVIRAVYNGTQQWLSRDCPAFPLRATDSLEKTLFIIDEDLDELAQDIAEQSGRMLDNLQDNPFFPVLTASDLVQMLNAQPMTAKRQQRLFTT